MRVSTQRKGKKMNNIVEALDQLEVLESSQGLRYDVSTRASLRQVIALLEAELEAAD